jgi:hypothetical protein
MHETPKQAEPARAYHRTLWFAKKFGRKSWG